MQKNAPCKPRSLRTRPVATGPAVVGISTAMLMPLGVLAETATTTELPTVVVKARAIQSNPNAELKAPYKAKTSADTRRTRPLAETPATVSVVTREAFEDAGVTDLKQILSAQPGITLGTGENGNMFGDRYIIRGYEAKSDVFVDGLRDPGMTTRESFAVEQLEITKGPSSTFAGRGSAGGAVNAITKQATLDYDFTRTAVGLGTDKYQRHTLDINRVFSDNFALRANVLYGSQDVPDRAPSSRERKGLALSGLWEVNTDLSVTLDYYTMLARDNQPDLGSYLKGTGAGRKPASDVPVYAQKSDFLTSDTNTMTARISYRLAPDMRITSLTRYGTANNAYATTGASFNTNAQRTAIDNGHTGWQDVEYFAHQTNLRWDKSLFGLKNEFIFGFEFTDHKATQGNFTASNANAFNCRTATGSGANNAYCISDASGNFTGDPTTVAGRTYSRNGKNQTWHVKTVSLSAMDTIDLTEKLTLTGGIRSDWFDFSLVRYQNTGATAGAVTGNYGYRDTLFNGHLGLSYKLHPAGMVYANYATAQNINGGETDSGTNSGYGGLLLYNGNAAGAKPVTTRNVEVGTKWNLFDSRLLATLAWFQITKSDVMEGASYDQYGTFNTGKNRVEGVELSLAGNVTDKFMVQAGAAFMKSKVLASTTASRVGHQLANFSDQSFSVLGRYQLTPNFYLGAQVRHQSERCGGQPDTGVDYVAGSSVCTQPVPAFTVYDAFAGYRINKKVDVRLNVVNLTNKDYYTAVYRSGSFLYKGDARQAYLTVNVDW